MTTTTEAIPSGFYWDSLTGNFYDAGDMSPPVGFHDQWVERKDEFPQSREALEIAEWKQCSCILNTDKKLQEQGFQLARGLYSFQMPDLNVIYLLPLERTDGKKLKVADPKTIKMSHCPFCGKSFKAPDPAAS